MNVLLLSRHGRLAPNSRVRSYQYIPFLKSQGIYVKPEPLSTDKYLKDCYCGKPIDWQDVILSYTNRIFTILKSHRFDLLWIEHELFPYFPALGEVVLYRMKIPYIVDLDDAVFHRYDSHSRKFVRRLFGGKIDTVMRNASVVTVGNKYLADRARQAGAKRVEIIPTVVDLERYRVAASQKGSGFTIGWIGTPTNAKYIRIAEPAIAEICNCEGAKLILVGSGPVSFNRIRPTVLQWSEETEVEEIKKFDVGIMPLPDDSWTRGKCGYKLIQYMACALPVVASRVGANTDIVDHGKTGFLVTSEKEWIEHLETLRDDPALRERMGRKGLKKVMESYSLQVMASRLTSFIRSCL